MIPSPAFSEFIVGPFTVRLYAVCIIAGIVVAAWLTSHRLRKRGIDGGAVVDVALWAVPFGIIGARLYHVVTHPGDYFGPGMNLLRIFYVWEGGIAIFGALLFGSVGAYIGCRRVGIPFLRFADALAPGLLVAQAIGRLGNYFNQELFGVPTGLPWGLNVSSSAAAYPMDVAPGTLFHPLFLYEMLWNLAGALAIVLIDRRRLLADGQALGAYLLIYGVGRAWLETLRIDPTGYLLLGMKINMVIAVIAAALGISLIVVRRASARESAPGVSPTLDGRSRSRNQQGSPHDVSP